MRSIILRRNGRILRCDCWLFKRLHDKAIEGRSEEFESTNYCDERWGTIIQKANKRPLKVIK